MPRESISPCQLLLDKPLSYSEYNHLFAFFIPVTLFHQHYQFDSVLVRLIERQLEQEMSKQIAWIKQGSHDEAKQIFTKNLKTVTALLSFQAIPISLHHH